MAEVRIKEGALLLKAALSFLARKQHSIGPSPSAHKIQNLILCLPSLATPSPTSFSGLISHYLSSLFLLLSPPTILFSSDSQKLAPTVYALSSSTITLTSKTKDCFDTRKLTMHFGNFIHFGAAAIMAVGQAEAWIPYSKLAVPRSNTTSVRSNVTVHGTTDLIVKTLNHTTYTIFSPVITGEPATAVLSSVATLTLTALVPHKSKNQKREVTAVVALGGYGTPSSTWSSNTQAAEGVSGAGLSCSTCACVHVTETVQITTVASVTATVTVTAGSTTPSLLSTDQSSNTAGTAGVTGTANSISTTSTTSSSRYSTTTTTGNTMISASGTTAPSETGTLSGLTVPPAQSETSGPEASATHQSDGGRSLHTSTWSLTGLVMGTSLFSIALAFLVAV